MAASPSRPVVFAVLSLAAGVAAAADPIAIATARVFDLNSFTDVVSVPSTTGAIAQTASYEQPGGMLGSSFVRSIARFDGFIAAAAQASVPSGGHVWEWSSRSQYRMSFTNTAGTDQTYVFDFDIFRMSLRLVDLEGVSQSASIFANVQINRPAGGGEVVFRLDEELEGGLTRHTLQDGSSFVPDRTFTCARPSGSRCGDINYEFDPYHGTVVLGTFQPGETFELQYDLEARATANTFNVNGAAAFIGDPFDVTGSGVGGTVRVLTPVPEPAGWMLFGAGALLTVPVVRRRRAAAAAAAAAPAGLAA